MFEVVIEVFVNVIERLATRYTPENKLLWAEIMIRLGTLSVGRFHLLSSPMTVGGMNVFELSGEFVIIHYLVDGFLFGNNGWSRLLFTSAIAQIPLFGNVLQVSELPLEVFSCSVGTATPLDPRVSVPLELHDAAGDILECNLC